MHVDRERFLALALALSACHRAVPVDDPRCAGVAWVAEAPRCVATRDGWHARGFVDSGYCASEAPDGRCTQNEYTPGEYADGSPGTAIGPDCSGVAWIQETETCVAWRTGKLKKGYVPTQECVRWDGANRCIAVLFVPGP